MTDTAEQPECGAYGPPNGWLCREIRGHAGGHVYRPSEAQMAEPVPQRAMEHFVGNFVGDVTGHGGVGVVMHQGYANFAGSLTPDDDEALLRKLADRLGFRLVRKARATLNNDQEG